MKSFIESPPGRKGEELYAISGGLSSGQHQSDDIAYGEKGAHHMVPPDATRLYFLCQICIDNVQVLIGRFQIR